MWIRLGRGGAPGGDWEGWGRGRGVGVLVVAPAEKPGGGLLAMGWLLGHHKLSVLNNQPWRLPLLPSCAAHSVGNSISTVGCCCATVELLLSSSCCGNHKLHSSQPARATGSLSSTAQLRLQTKCWG